MVARGDLGVDIPLARVPLVQKEIIRQCNFAGKPVITATQMLESMLAAARPTRAEVADVANAIFDGTDATMLSGETSVGKYPVAAVRTMATIARETEKKLPYERFLREAGEEVGEETDELIGYTASYAAGRLGAAAIVAFTESGATARLVSQFRPRQPVLAMTPSERVYRQLALPWGVTPHHLPRYDRVDEMFQKGMELLQTEKHVSEGDLVVGVFGTSPVPGATSMIKIHKF